MLVTPSLLHTVPSQRLVTLWLLHALPNQMLVTLSWLHAVPSQRLVTLSLLHAVLSQMLVTLSLLYAIIAEECQQKPIILFLAQQAYNTAHMTRPPAPPLPIAEQPTWQQAWKEQLTWSEEEVLRVPKDTDGAWPCHVCQDVHDGEGPAEDAKAQARHCHMANKHLPSTSMPHSKQTPAINVTWQTNTCCQHHCHMANACHQHHCNMANIHLPWTSLPQGKHNLPSTSPSHSKHTPAINTTATWQTNTCYQRHCHMANKHLPSTSLPHGKLTPAINITATWQTPASNNTTAWQTNICHQHHYHMAKLTPYCQHQNTPWFSKWNQTLQMVKQCTIHKQQ